MTKYSYALALILFLIILSDGCRVDDMQDDGDLTSIAYAPSAYAITRPTGFPVPEIPDANKMTYEGIQLGRKLFYDPILSRDSSMSCATCHLPKGSFTDNFATSKGVDGLNGTRSSMSIINFAFDDHSLFWDGRASTLENQALQPVENPIEMHEIWPNVIQKLINHPTYPSEFRKAFGISNKKEITKELAAKAIAQFERTLISSNSAYDRKFISQTEEPTDEEVNGYFMYFDAETPGITVPPAHCGHCHNGPLLTTNQFFNNGLTEAPNLTEFPDLGRGAITGNAVDNGKFKVPSLRNIALTAPYMHDGRFTTLEQVIDHYNSGGHYAPNKDPFIKHLNLNQQNISDLLAFLKLFTDTTYVNNPDFQNPFK
ncbi:MAG: cytochrome C peroxidase [Saprospiraceae bacterium]|nr:cytochrome C peroxidase [Saprospiraceae bacterium]